MHRALKLHHPKHSGKLIHHRHTSYWALALIIVVAGVFVTFIDRAARADTLDVSAVVPAPIPPDPAVFTSPATNSIFTNPVVTVEGTCPVISPAVIIVIYRGAEAIGSSTCSASGEFEVDVTLQRGTQSLIARILTITGQWGQDSIPLTLTYTPAAVAEPTSPVSPTTPRETISTNGSFISPVASPLLIQLENPVITYRPGFSIQLKARFSGGTLPYTVVIAWGDGSSRTETIHDHEFHAFSHVYTANNVERFSLTITDSTGQAISQTYAVVNLVPSAITNGPTAAGILDTFTPNSTWLAMILYSLLLVMILVLWHYERSHYRQRIGIPMHYPWQHKKMSHK